MRIEGKNFLIQDHKIFKENQNQIKKLTSHIQKLNSQQELFFKQKAFFENNLASMNIQLKEKDKIIDSLKSNILKKSQTEEEISKKNDGKLINFRTI